jgi:NAD(P)-dependent dehydrogenase (short-subunit alcohol dehydrogenase family)
MKHLLVVGGTKGLGRALVEAAKDDCDHLTVLARTVPERSDNARISYISVDITERALLDAAFSKAVSTGGPVSAMALFQQYRGQTEPWDKKLAITLTATKHAFELFAKHCPATGDKAVVLLTSNASRFACEEQDDAYHAAKTGLLGLCRYYACALGPQGIRVNCVSPGTVLKDESKQFYLGNPELMGVFKKVIPLNRMGTASEVASAVKYLLSEQASFITGQELVVDGGASLRSQESLARALLASALSTPNQASIRHG